MDVLGPVAPVPGVDVVAYQNEGLRQTEQYFAELREAEAGYRPLMLSGGLDHWGWGQTEFPSPSARQLYQTPSRSHPSRRKHPKKVQPRHSPHLTLSDEELVALGKAALNEHGSVPIGQLGSLMHKAAKDHRLPALLRDRYGGLKKFVESHEEVFFVDDDHPFNPHVRVATPEDKLSLKSRELSLLTPVVAMDCEMVGIGSNGSKSSLARCSIVDYNGNVILDKFVRQTVEVTDYRTHVSGIRPENLVHGEDFLDVRRAVSAIIRGRVVVGHSLDADLQALELEHPRELCRDTAYSRLLCPTRPRSLKTLVKERLGIDIQSGEHDSVEDARVVLSLYKSIEYEWESAFW